MSIMIDLSFLNTLKHLWDKEIIDKLDFSIDCFKKGNTEESMEECFFIFCLDFQRIKDIFINELRDLSMIMKCRTMADMNSNFGGKQCANFVNNIKIISNKYLNSSIYSNQTSCLSVHYMVEKLKKKAQQDESYALMFEDLTKTTYLNTGKDNTLEIFNNSGWKNTLGSL